MSFLFRSRIPLPPIPTKAAAKPCKKKRPKMFKENSKKQKDDASKSRKLVIKSGKTISGPKTPTTPTPLDITDKEVVINVGDGDHDNKKGAVAKGNSDGKKKGNNKSKDVRIDMPDSDDGAAKPSYAIVDKSKKNKKKGFSKESVDSIPDYDALPIPPKRDGEGTSSSTSKATEQKKSAAVERYISIAPVTVIEKKERTTSTSSTEGEKENSTNAERPTSTTPDNVALPPTPARAYEKKESSGTVKDEKKSDQMKKANQAKSGDSNTDVLRDKNKKTENKQYDGKKVTYKQEKDEVWNERSPDVDDDKDILGKKGEKTAREKCEEKKKAFLTKVKKESFEGRMPDDDEDDDDIYGGMNPYENDEKEDNDDQSAVEKDNDENREDDNKNGANEDSENEYEEIEKRRESTQTEENWLDDNNGTDYIKSDSIGSEVNEEDADYTVTKPEVGENVDDGANEDAESNTDEGDDKDDRDDLNGDEAQDLSHLSDHLYAVPDDPNTNLNSYLKLRGNTKKKEQNKDDENENGNDYQDDNEEGEGDDKKDFDLYEGFNFDDPFHLDNIRVGLELCPVLVSNKGLGSRYPLRIENYIM